MSVLRLLLLCSAAIMPAGCSEPDLRSKAESGDPVAQFELGMKYHTADGVPRDHEVAVKLWRKSANQGYVTAQYMLGFVHKIGSGVYQSPAEAAKWYRMIAENEDAETEEDREYVIQAQWELGSMCVKGSGVPKDYAEAAKWYQKAAQKGNREAQKALGLMLLNGIGVTRDLVAAEKWISEWAKKATAQDFYWLALTFTKEEKIDRWSWGDDLPPLPQSYELAAKWYLRASLLGDVPAQHELGTLYLNGTGVAADLEEAYAWLNLASVHNESSRVKIFELEQTLSPERLARAQKRSTELHREIAARKNGEHK